MIDLHLHTTYSDGTRTPKELVFATRYFEAIAITDHDTIGGIDEAQAAALEAGWALNVLPGIELSAVLADTEVHILGYGIDYCSEVLLKKLSCLSQEREDRIAEMVDKLTKLGYPLSLDDLPVTGIPGRAHVARAMVKKSYVSSVSEAFQRFLNPGKPGYVPRSKLSPTEAVELIHQAKGVAVVAHPGLINLEFTKETLKIIPVDGLEAYHSAHQKEETTFFINFARENNLLITGGSDCHGPHGKDKELLGSIDLPSQYYEQLLNCMGFIP